MAISAVSVSPNSLNSSGVKSKADETLEQLAQQGDQNAIAELKQQQELENPTTTTQAAGPSEPGKGEQIDHYG